MGRVLKAPGQASRVRESPMFVWVGREACSLKLTTCSSLESDSELEALPSSGSP